MLSAEEKEAPLEIPSSAFEKLEEASKSVTQLSSKSLSEMSAKKLEATVSSPPSTTIGLPLQASSPVSGPASFNEERGGDGDAHNLPSFQELLSPIHRSRACHQILLPNRIGLDFNPLQKLPSAPAVTSARKALDTEQEQIIVSKIEKMPEEDAKKLLAKVMKQNLNLRQELRSKEKRITAFKGQMLALLEWKAKQEMDAFSEGSSSEDTRQSASRAPSKITRRQSRSMSKSQLSESENSSESTESSENSEDAGNSFSSHPPRTGSAHNVTVVEEVYGIRRSLSVIQELASSIDIDQDMLRHRIKNGCYLTNQLLLGSVSGWLSALFVKKFGKIALSAAGGGLILLIYTTRKGFVNVNYESIYQELSKLCECPDDEEVEAAEKRKGSLSRLNSSVTFREDHASPEAMNKSRSQQECTTWDRIRTCRRWMSANTYTVGGFVLTFIYNVV